MINNLKGSVVSALKIVAILWAVHLVNILTLLNLNNFGIHPRNIFGLIGIPLAPFLHWSIAHLFSNSVPLFILLIFLFSFNGGIAKTALAYIALASGAGIWIFGAPRSLHVGASGVVFGLIGFLIFAGFYKKNSMAVLVSFIVLLLYGGAIFSLFAITPNVSWSGHLFGFLGGIYAAKKLLKT